MRRMYEVRPGGRVGVLFSVLLIFFFYSAEAQNVDQVFRQPVVEIDLATQRLDKPPPYDVPIRFVMPVSDKVDSSTMIIYKGSCVSARSAEENGDQQTSPQHSERLTWKRSDQSKAVEIKKAYFDLQPSGKTPVYLVSGRKYCIVVNNKIDTSPSPKPPNPCCSSVQPDANQTSAAMVNTEASPTPANSADPNPKTSREEEVRVEFETRAPLSSHLSLDFGLAFLKPDGQVKNVPVLATTTLHIHGAPFNRQVDLADPLSGRREFYSRMSLFVGLAPFTLRDPTTQGIQNRSSFGNIVAGVGMRAPFYGWRGASNDPGRNSYVDRWRRWQSALRLNVGLIWMQQDDPNPLISEGEGVVQPYVGLSYDISAKQLIGPLAGLFGL